MGQSCLPADRGNQKGREALSRQVNSSTMLQDASPRKAKNGNQDIYKGLKANKTRNKSNRNENVSKAIKIDTWKQTLGKQGNKWSNQTLCLDVGSRGKRGYPNGLLENKKFIKGVINNMNTHARRQQHVPDSKNSSPSTRDRHHGGVSKENQSPHYTSLYRPFEDGGFIARPHS